MKTLADFLINRARELDAEEAKLREQKRAIDAERDQLWRAAKAAGGEVAKAFTSDRDQVVLDDAVEGTDAAIGRMVERHKKRAAEATIKDAVLSILAEAGRGMTALEILPLVNERLAIDYPRTSLSPQLSRLKADGKLVRGEGNVWSLPSETSKASAPKPPIESSELFS